MRDEPLSAIVDLYEFKLAGMAHAEATMHDMLSSYDKTIRMIKRSLLLSQAEVRRNKLFI